MKIYFLLVCMSTGLIFYTGYAMQEPSRQATEKLAQAIENSGTLVKDQERALAEATQAIAQGADVNALMTFSAFDGTHTIPMINAAARKGNFYLIRLLYNQGVPINSQEPLKRERTRWQPTSVIFGYLASQPGSSTLDEAGRWLLLHGARLNTQSASELAPLLGRRYFIWQWLFMHGFSIRHASRAQDDVIGTLIQDTYEHRPLLQAIILNHDTHYLLKNMASQKSLNEGKKNELRYALMLAAAQCSSALRYIFEHKTLVSQLSLLDFMDAMSKAVLVGYLDGVKMLSKVPGSLLTVLGQGLSRAKIISCIENFIRYAYVQEHTDVVEYFHTINDEFKLDINFNDVLESIRPQPHLIQAESGETPGGDKEKEKEKENTPSVESQDDFNEQLTRALAAHDVKEIEAWLRQGANPNSNAAQRALIRASTQADLELIQLLFSYGASLNVRFEPANDSYSKEVNLAGWMPGGNLVWGLVQAATCNKSKPLTDRVIEGLKWLDMHGADLNQHNTAGYSVISSASRSQPKIISWLLEHGVTFAPQAFSNKQKRQRVREQIEAAYPDQPLLQEIALAQSGNPSKAQKQQKAHSLIEELNEEKMRDSFNLNDAKLINHAFTLAVAQNNNLYKMIMGIEGRNLSNPTLQQALITAANRGNSEAAEAIIHYAHADIRVKESDWHEAILKALNGAILHNNLDIINHLVITLPVEVINEAIDRLQLAVFSTSTSEREHPHELIALLARIREKETENNTLYGNFSNFLVNVNSHIFPEFLPALFTIMATLWQRSSHG